MSSSAPIRYEQAMDRYRLSGSANWKCDEGVALNPTAKVGAPPWRFQHFAGLALFVASSLSSCVDPWVHVQQQCAQVTTMVAAFRPYRRRRISALEARAMALGILHRAEEGRERLAQKEAERGINWEEMS